MVKSLYVDERGYTQIKAEKCSLPESVLSTYNLHKTQCIYVKCIDSYFFKLLFLVLFLLESGSYNVAQADSPGDLTSILQACLESKHFITEL